MAKMNKFRNWIIQDLTQFVTKTPFQNETIACFHTTSPPGRFWSFLEFSKKEEQYLNRTKENEASEDNVNLSGTLLALPRSQMFQLPFSENETFKDSSVLNINFKNFKKEDFLEQATENVNVKKNLKNLESKINNSSRNNISNDIQNAVFEMTTTKNGISKIGPKNLNADSVNYSADPEAWEIVTKSNSLQNDPKNNFSKDYEALNSSSFYETTPKISSSENLPRQTTMKKRAKSGSMRMKKPFSILNSDSEKSSNAFMIPVEASRLQRSKSFSIVSRHSSGVAESTRNFDWGPSKQKLPNSSMQVANMSSGKRNKNRKKANNNDSQDCPPPCPPPPPPCCPPPPPPPCCPPPPPPPCCPPPKKAAKPKYNYSDYTPPPEPPCIPECALKPLKPVGQQAKKKKSCDDWCPDSNKDECYTSKCPPKKKNPCPKPRVCRPLCFEPDPCEKPKSFCVGCPSKKTNNNNNNREFSTWNRVATNIGIASRSFSTDPCGNKSQKTETVEERFNKRIPKPGPACKEAKDDDKFKPAASLKPKDDKNSGKSASDKKSCQNSAVSAKYETQKTKDLMKKEFEEVQKCKEGEKEPKKSETEAKKSAAEKDKKTVSDKCLDKKAATEKDKKTVSDKCLDKKTVSEKDKKTVTDKCLDKKAVSEKDKKTVTDKCLDKKTVSEKDKKTVTDKCLDKKAVSEKDKKTVTDKCLDKKAVSEKDKKTVTDKCLDKKLETEKDKKSGTEKCLDKNSIVKSVADDEVKVQSILEKIINPSKIEGMVKTLNKTEDTKYGIKDPFSSCKKILTLFQKEQNDFKTPGKMIDGFHLRKNILDDSRIFEKIVEKELPSNFLSGNVVKEVEPRNWLSSWFF